MAEIVTRVVEALAEAGITAQAAYPGGMMPNISGSRAAVSLEKLDHTARAGTVLVTVMTPVAAGGSVCEETAIQVGRVLEEMGGICTQEGCKFNGYADAYYIRVLGTFYGGAVMDGWNTAADFTVTTGLQSLPNTVSFRAEQAVDTLTGTPLNTSVWSFRLVEEFGRGQAPLPSPVEPFTLTITRTSGIENYNECTWTAVELENTATGLRQIRKGVAKSRSFLAVG